MEKFEVKNKKLFKYCAGSLKKKHCKARFSRDMQQCREEYWRASTWPGKINRSRIDPHVVTHVITGNIDRRVAERKLEMKQKKWK